MTPVITIEHLISPRGVGRTRRRGHPLRPRHHIRAARSTDCVPLLLGMGALEGVQVAPDAENSHYLRTKPERMGH